MDIKLVAIDMDGTLLNNKNEITEKTKQILKKATSEGVKIVVTTGRVLKSALYYSKHLDLDSYVVACNGGIIVDKNTNVLSKRPISKHKMMEIMEVGKDYSVYFHFYNEDSFFTNKYVKEVSEYYSNASGKLKGQDIDVVLYEENNEILNRDDLDIYKFLFLEPDIKKLTMVREKLSKIEGLSLSSSWGNNVEVMNKGVSKGSAISLLCDKLEIGNESVMAIGDNENDLSMINFAGIGVAMANGNSLLKGSADFIAPSNEEDGVAYAIQKFVL